MLPRRRHLPLTATLTPSSTPPLAATRALMPCSCLPRRRPAPADAAKKKVERKREREEERDVSLSPQIFIFLFRLNGYDMRVSHFTQPPRQPKMATMLSRDQS
jgi:hypothetical protein